MKILMIAPEPFFEPRGTPFSEYHRIRAMLELGHTVDLVTYPFGKDVSMPGLRLFRCLRPPFVHDVRIGPSLAKIPLDAAIALTTIRRALSERYDAVHSHEEGSFIGIVLAGLLGIPHLYDMHSSLPQQLGNFAFSKSRLLKGAFSWMERLVIRRSKVVIVICPQLEETVRGIDRDVPTVLIENAPGSGDTPREGSGARVRSALGLAADTPIVLYTGTFEAYQGLDLLFAAARVVRRPPGRALRSCRRTSGTDRAGQGAGASRGRGRKCRVCRAAARRRNSRVPRRRRRPGLAAQPRHQHAAQDLSIPALGPSDRRHAARHPYAGARRRGVVPDAGDAGRVCRRHPRRHRRSCACARSRRRRRNGSPKPSTATRPT